MSKLQFSFHASHHRQFSSHEQACKPDSVPRQSAGAAVIYLGRQSPAASSSLPGDQRMRVASRTAFAALFPCLALLRLGVAWPSQLPETPVGSYPTFSPSPDRGQAVCFCGPIRGSPRLGVTQQPTLWSPDFPRLVQSTNRDRPARSHVVVILTRPYKNVKKSRRGVLTSRVLCTILFLIHPPLYGNRSSPNPISF